MTLQFAKKKLNGVIYSTPSFRCRNTTDADGAIKSCLHSIRTLSGTRALVMESSKERLVVQSGDRRVSRCYSASERDAMISATPK